MMVAPSGRNDWTEGTVTAIDEDGAPKGVRVRLDHLVNGVGNCYATHDELLPACTCTAEGCDGEGDPGCAYCRALDIEDPCPAELEAHHL